MLNDEIEKQINEKKTQKNNPSRSWLIRQTHGMGHETDITS